MLDRLLARLSSYRPSPPAAVDQERLVWVAAAYFNLPVEEARARYESYRSFHKERGYALTLGEDKTLAFEEAYLLYLAALRLRPAQVVEIGTQQGKSTRRIVDMLQLLEIPAEVTCFDIVDELRFVTHEEVRLVIRDISGRFRQEVLETLQPGLIFLDARPYRLLKEVIYEFLRWPAGRPALLAIHDCSPGLYNPRMRIPKDRPERVNSLTGVWERHVLAEVFGIPQVMLDDHRTPGHHLRIFPTRHGLALLTPRDWLIMDGDENPPAEDIAP